ncbi:uncharacterized protein LOC8281844 isoform X2 [Ricinus communis]|uniref:GCK domain-containing protein n=1 Tax=Ricinus communis TaxID=3988 RepID=B9S907_RICCO|nr:uncharacterized protein LOC8281844 isoform X2 [Ricinus communis]EEF39968.1 conserved hypothetical protein [Ricinus communis]|eukprot:XP_002522476.1 uncharacterized protein LOC8281844 [Ricinus communis]
MGAIFSSTDSEDLVPDSPIATDSPKPNSSSSPRMTSSSDPETQTIPESKNFSTETKPSDQNQQADQEDNEEGECGFCLFMKGGGCKDVFIDWENCVKEADLKEENVVNKCFEATSALRKCMQAHADYYDPILKAEKAAEEEVMKQLEEEKASESNLVTEKKTVNSSDSNSGT